MKFNIGTRELEFNQETKEIIYKNKVFTPSVRTFGDMKVLYNKGTLEDEYGLYFMYRDVYFNDEDKELLRKNNIRYDITIIIPKLISGEYNKTYGHYHPENNNGKKYQELYQVLSGKAIYLQQNKKKVFYTLANEKDAVNMDESFGHITINPSENEILIMANLVDDTFSSIYDDYKTNSGGMYYLYKNGWETNEKYEKAPELNESKELFPNKSKSIYDDFINNPSIFNYLH